MKNQRLRSCLVMFLCFLLPFSVYVGWCVSGLFSMSVSADGLSSCLMYVLLHPFSVTYLGKMTITCIGLAVLVWLLAFCYAYTEASRNLLPGKEGGSMRWMSFREFNKKYADKDEHNNMILSENIRKSYNDKKTFRNNNVLMIGGAGAGKTGFFNTPNILNCFGSNIYTDPKGTLLVDYGNYLKAQGIRVLSINLCEFEKSMCFNPFEYIRTRADIWRLINNILQNTNPENNVSNADPFWEKAEKMFLFSIFSYVWYECPRTEANENTGEFETLEKNFESVIKLINEATTKVILDPEATLLSHRMDELREEDPGHISVLMYDGSVGGDKAVETVSSIVLTAATRFAPFNTPEILRILSKNEIPIEELGIGINADGKSKTALFIIIPSEDTTFNFIPGMIYTMLFQELYYQAKFFPGNRLPIQVGCWFDEFANIKMPSNFERILATCRSLGIYIIPMLQSLSQIKNLYQQDKWEGIVGNCDTLIYLGGNEKSTYQYVSEMLGKWTMDKRTQGQTLGAHGNSSRNYDVQGRELLDAAEVRVLSNDECIIFVRGEYPIRDKKWFPWAHDIVKTAESYGKYVYDYREHKEGQINEDDSEDEMGLIGSDTLNYYKTRAKHEDNVRIYTMSPRDFLSLNFDELNEKDSESIEDIFESLQSDEAQKKLESGAAEDEYLKKEYEEEKWYRAYHSSDDIIELLASDSMPEEIKQLVVKYAGEGLSESVIKRIINPENTLEVMEKLEAAALLMAGHA